MQGPTGTGRAARVTGRPNEREVGGSTHCDRRARLSGHKALLYEAEPGRRMVWLGEAGGGGDPAPGVLRERVPVLGRQPI